MLRDRRLSHIEDLDKRMHVEFTMIAVSKLLDNANPNFMGYGAKGLCELSGDNNTCWHSYILIYTKNYNHIVLEQK